MKKIDRKIEEIKKMQEELYHRTQVEQEAEALIFQCRFEEAIALLDTLDAPTQQEKEGEPMKINKQKLQIALATACMDPYDLCRAVDIQYQTYRRIVAGNKCKFSTVGKIAKALNVPVEDLIDMEGEM